MTDNGSAYRSKLFASILQQASIHHIRTDPIRREPTARPSALSRPHCASGPTSGHTQWMRDHAAISFFRHGQAWLIEDHFIADGPALPLNLKGSTHALRQQLSALRATATEVAL